MEANKSLREIVTDIYQTFYELLRNIANLAIIEAKQVKSALAKMAIAIFVVVLSTLFTWLGICSFICILLTMYGYSWVFSILFVTAINLFIAIASITYLLGQNKAIRFSATAKQIGIVIDRSKDN